MILLNQIDLDNGIEGNIPKKLYFGNLIATMLLQFKTGTNKLYDALNGSICY